MMPQLDKCLKFKSIRVVDTNYRSLFKMTPKNVRSFRHVSSCGTIENHLTLFKERHLLDEDRVGGIFNPQPRRRDAILVLGCNISSVLNSCCKVATSIGMMPLYLIINNEKDL